MRKFILGEEVEIFIDGSWSGEVGVLFLYARFLGKEKHRVKYKGYSVYETVAKVRKVQNFTNLLTN